MDFKTIEKYREFNDRSEAYLFLGKCPRSTHPRLSKQKGQWRVTYSYSKDRAQMQYEDRIRLLEHRRNA